MVFGNWKRSLMTIAVAGVLVACGSESSDSNVGTFKGIPEVASAGGGGGGNTLVVDTAAGGDLKFAETSLTASTGTIKVTFNNKGAVQHNWVLVKAGDEQKVVDEASTAAPDFLPKDSFVAHSKTLAGGQSEEFSFDVAEAGAYSYICTYPGHYAGGMKGTLDVKEGTGAPAAGGGAGGSTIDTADAANLKFTQADYSFAAGDVSITFNNKASAGLKHNAVIVKTGDEQKVADASAAAAPDFLPKDSFVAHSKTIDGGQSDTFTAKLEPGTYSLICTFPGHYAAGMKSTVTVK